MGSDSIHCSPQSAMAVSSEQTSGIPASDLTQTSHESQNRQLELQLLDAQRLEDLGMLAAGIAHDFNNLITAALGYTELARAALPAESLPAVHCEHASRGLRRAAEFARQLLAYAGRGRLQIAPVNVTKTIQDLEGLLDTWIGGHGSIVRNLDPHLPEIAADPIQIAQLVMNLVGNAAESITGDQGQVLIGTSIQECDVTTFRGCRPSDLLPAGTYVKLSVKDSGSGIPADIRPRMFDPFFSTKENSRGERGLGLSIIQGIVVRHHGTIRVESEPDQGTTITVYLPTFGSPDPILSSVGLSSREISLPTGPASVARELLP